MHNFNVRLRNEKSNNVSHYMSTQIRQYFNNNLHPFIWIQFCIFRCCNAAKIFQGRQLLSSESLSLIPVEKSFSYSESSPVSYVLILSSMQFNALKSAPESFSFVLLPYFFLSYWWRHLQTFLLLFYFKAVSLLLP